MASNVRDLAKERRWREVASRFLRSGLSVRAFCRREGLAESAFYFWRRELARRDGERSRETSPGPALGTTRRPEFLPVRVMDAAPPGASIALELGGGRVLRLPESMPVRRIAQLVLAIEAPSVQVNDVVAAEAGANHARAEARR